MLSHTVEDLYRVTSDSKANATCPTFKGVVADIAKLNSVGAILTAIEEAFPSKKIDILVLNAAINKRPKLGQASDVDIESSLVGNLQWPIVLMENLVREKSFDANSRVIVMSSDRVRDPAPGTALFNATKAGLEALTRSWAVELPLHFPGTTVNAVSVGLTDTPGLRSFPAQIVEAVKAQRIPKVKVVQGGRMGYAEDVADVVGLLVSDKARWQTGSVVAANGGAEWIGGT